MTLAFAHRGAPTRGVRENTLPAFRAALDAGVDALESDVWLTADGVPVLEHDGALGPHWNRRRLREMRADELPDWLPTLAELYRELGTGFSLSLDLKDPDGAAAVLAVADDAGATSRLWLCAELPALEACRRRSAEVRLANSTRLRGRTTAPLVRRLADAGVDALNLREPEWTPVRVEMTHTVGLAAFAWDVQTTAVLDRVLGDGCDAVYSDSVPLLLDAAARPR